MWGGRERRGEGRWLQTSWLGSGVRIHEKTAMAQAPVAPPLLSFMPPGANSRLAPELEGVEGASMT